jgi:hypothetical protein
MKRILTLLALTTTLLGAAPMPGMPDPRAMARGGAAPTSVICEPRILARVNGKVITTGDLVQRMDRILKTQAPHLVDEPAEKFQFYQAYWRPVLEEMIDSQLILADAQEREIVVEEGDVRDELNKRLGSSPHEKLEQMGCSFEEALQMVREELTTQRMIGMMAYSKAFLEVTPGAIKAAYDREYGAQGQERLRYRVLTLRSKDAEAAAEAAQRLETLAKQPSKEPVEKWADLARKGDKRINAQLSEEWDRVLPEMSELHAKALGHLQPGQVTGPLFQQGAEGESIFRLFYLADRSRSDPPPFAQMQQSLRNRLLDQVVQRETDQYLGQLRRQYHAEELVTTRLDRLGDSLFALQ